MAKLENFFRQHLAEALIFGVCIVEKMRFWPVKRAS